MIIVCDPDPGVRKHLAGLLDSDVAPTELNDAASLRAAIDQVSHPTVLVLGSKMDVDDVLGIAANLEGRTVPAAIVLVRESLDAGTVRRALRSGISDVLGADELDAEEFRAAIERAFADAREHAPVSTGGAGGTEGRVVTVFSTKGGCGKSLVASNLAVLLGQTGASVALVDLDLQSGDLAIMMQVMPSLSIYDAAQSTDRMDADALVGYLTPHASGVSLLAAPLEPSLSEAVTPASVSTILKLLRSRYDFVVIDGPAFFTDQILVAIDQSDQVVLVGSLDVPSVKNLRTALTTLHQLGHPRERILTVLNRADSNVGLRVPEVEKSLGTSIDVQLPSSREVPLSINQGSPLAADRRRSDVVQAISQLVPRIAPDRAEHSESGRSLFRRR